MCHNRLAGSWRNRPCASFSNDPQSLRLIRLVFREENVARTQEFVLRWSPAANGTPREIVRQQYHFSPGTTEEIQEYRVELENVAPLELTIIPDAQPRQRVRLTRGTAPGMTGRFVHSASEVRFSHASTR